MFKRTSSLFKVIKNTEVGIGHTKPGITGPTISIIISLISFIIGMYVNTYAEVNIIVSLCILNTGFIISNIFLVTNERIHEYDYKYKSTINDYYSDAALMEIAEKQDRIASALNGRIYFEGLTNLLKHYIRFMGKYDSGTMYATSTVNPGKVWTEEVRKANKAFLDRGGKIKRIFIIKNGLSQTEIQLLENEMNLQINLGNIELKYCYESELGGENLTDFIIHDNSKNVFIVNVDSHGVAHSCELIINELEYKLRKDHHDRIASFSYSWEHGKLLEAQRVATM